jgi:hypothetical protein
VIDLAGGASDAARRGRRSGGRNDGARGTSRSSSIVRKGRVRNECRPRKAS